MSVEGNSPFDDLRRALLDETLDPDAALDPGASLRIDPGRRRRTGIPEVVHAENKSASDVASALRRLAEANGRSIASRVPNRSVQSIRSDLALDFAVEAFHAARAMVVSVRGSRRPVRGGRVGILSAGSSDVPIASEAALMAEEMGSRVLTAWDVGVAGLHRLVEPLERFHAEGVDVVVVAAGMDGALPSVVAGLVDVPVVGLPTSIGYGLGAGGVGALTTMLQSCAPGLVVVNIDNGIGAGATAALIANGAARFRNSEANERRDD
jgi:NCAIR mutase (PurE)-related protein